MNRQPLVSVVIPFLNGPEFLREAIESVFAQTYHNWELLLVDDGSTDDSTALALGYAAKHSERVRYLDHPGHANLGASASRNLGSRSARGEFVAFLDADDVWLATKLDDQVAILLEHPAAGWVYGPGLWWYGWTGNADDVRRDYLQDVGIQNRIVGYFDLLSLFLRNEETVPSSFAIMARRELLERTGGGSEEWCRSVYDDQVAFAKLAVGAPVYVSDVAWYKYRQHPNSRCTAAFEADQYYSIRVQYLGWLRDYLAQQPGTDARLQVMVATELGAARIGCGDIEAGARDILPAVVRSAFAAPDVEKLSKAIVHRALRSVDPDPAGFVRAVFMTLPETSQMRRLRARLLGDVNAALARQHGRAGQHRLARRHAWRAVLADPSFLRNRTVMRVAIESLLGTSLTNRLRARMSVSALAATASAGLFR